MVARFVAGPAIRNTNAAPGSAPAPINAAAKGTDAVAHVYIGIATKQIANNPVIPVNPQVSKNDEGKSPYEIMSIDISTRFQ